MVGYNCFIIFQYYYLHIKILKFYENWNFWNFLKILKYWKKFGYYEAAGRDTGITSIVTLYNTRNTSIVMLQYW